MSKRPVIHDYIESLREHLATPGGPVDQLARSLFEVSPLICQGTYFGPDKDLTERHTPFIAIAPAADVDADIELYRADDQGAAPRYFALDVVVGLSHRDPVELPPEADTRDTPQTYIAGNGAAGEAYAMAVANAVTSCFSAFGYSVESCTCNYSGVLNWPLEIYNLRFYFGTPRLTNTGAY